MLIRIKRKWFTTQATIGLMTIDEDSFSCFTIEDVARAAGVKIPKETAIPADIYNVIMDLSNRHKCIMPHIMNVLDFVGVRFDIANKATQVEGCIGVGHGKDLAANAVWDSASTHKVLCQKIQAALDRGELVQLVITNEQERTI